MSFVPLKIKLNLWKYKNDHSLMMLLYEDQLPSDSSPTTNNNWFVDAVFEVYNPLVIPYPVGTELFLAKHFKRYPYELQNIISIQDLYDIEQPGTYFVAYSVPYEGKVKLPFKDIYIYVDKLIYVSSFGS